MPDSYAGANYYPATITRPLGADRANAASVRSPLKELADRCTNLQTTDQLHATRLTALETYLAGPDKHKQRLVSPAPSTTVSPSDGDCIIWTSSDAGEITIGAGSAGYELEIMSIMDNVLTVNGVDWDGKPAAAEAYITLRWAVGSVYAVRFVSIGTNWRMRSKQTRTV